MVRNNVKWAVLDKETYSNNEVAKMQANCADRQEAARVLEEVKQFWYAIYNPVDLDDLTEDQFVQYSEEGRWILQHNCWAPSAECDTQIMFFDPSEVLDKDVMQYSFGLTYSVTVGWFDNPRAEAFRAAFMRGTD